MEYYINGKKVGAYKFCTRISKGRCHTFDSLPNSFRIPLLMDKEISMDNDIYRVKTSIENNGLKKRRKFRRLRDKLTRLVDKFARWDFWFAIYLLIVILSMIICYSLCATLPPDDYLLMPLLMAMPLYIMCGIPIVIGAIAAIVWIFGIIIDTIFS